jgi:hypothetical protein
VVFAFTVLALWPEPARTQAALEDIRRVLRPGGLLVVTVLAAAADVLPAQLATTGLAAGAAHACGQDVGYVCRRSDSP